MSLIVNSFQSQKSYALSNTSSGSKEGKKCTTSAVSAVIAAERRVMVTF